MIFTIFPIPLSIIKTYPHQLDYHLTRIENETKFSKGALKKNMAYVAVSDVYGIGLFVEKIV